MELQEALNKSSEHIAIQNPNPWTKFIVCQTGEHTYGVSTKDNAWVESSASEVHASLLMALYPVDKDGWHPCH